MIRLRVDRALRAYRLRIGKPVFLPLDGLDELEADYEAIYGARPIFRFHPHPALAEGECMVSLNTELT